MNPADARRGASPYLDDELTAPEGATEVSRADRAGRADPADPADPRRAGLAWPVVAAREVHVRLTDRNFLISTLSTILLMLIAFGAQGLLANRSTERVLVVTSAQAQAVADQVGTRVHAEDDKTSVVVRQVADEQAAEAAVTGDSADAWLRGGAVGADGWTLVTKNDTPPTDVLTATREVVRDDALARNAAAAGTTVPGLMAGTQVQIQVLQGSGTEMIVRMVAGFALAALFYMVSLMFGMAIASSVVEEKQSRIVEIIASAIPLRSLLVGKIVGNTVLAFMQMTLFMAAGLIGLQFTPYKEFITVISGPIGWFVAFFVAGFVALACLWAVAGSLSSRSEDLQTTSTPLTMLLFIAFFGGIVASGSVQTVLSYLPIASGVAMPMRLLQGNAAAWEPVASLLVTLAFAVAAILVGEKLYRRSVLQSGGRVSVTQALRAQD